MKLAEFSNEGFDRGRSRLVEACWRAVEGFFFNSWLPGSGWRVWLLRMFGGQVGKGVVIKPHVRVKFPWKLKIGDHSWIGESVWIDNLAVVTIGSNCCISQGAYLCTGSHRWDKQTFDLETRPITVEDQCWVGAMVRVAPGAILREGSVICLASTASGVVQSWRVYRDSAEPRVADRVEFKGPDQTL